MYNGLSLDQAPPLQSVLHFFVSVPVFGMIFALLLIFFPDNIVVSSHPIAMSALHLLVLGVISMSMFGALFQMQSVLGGNPIPAPLGNAFIIHLFFTLGVILLCSAFAFGNAVLFIPASVLLGASVLYLAQLILPLLFGSITHDTLRGMRLSLIALTITAILGIYLAHSYADKTIGGFFESIRAIHYSFALIGWIGSLIIAVAFQVIEMFYVTSSYSLWCKQNAFKILALSLIAKALLLIFSIGLEWIPDLFIGAILLGFASTTAKRLYARKRRAQDPSILFWSLGITLLAFSVVIYAIYLSIGLTDLLVMSLGSFLLFALSIILGMIGKIIPFLIWFHLSSSGYLDAPMMHEIIPAKRSQTLFGLMAAASCFSLCGIFFAPLIAASGILFFLLFALLGFNIFSAIRIYRQVVAKGERFSFGD